MPRSQQEDVPADENISPVGNGSSTEFLIFKCGDRSYAIDIMSVREIRAWSEPTPLPYSAEFILGVVNLRGVVLPVLDLAKRLGHPSINENLRNVIIVVTSGQKTVGLLVESVSDIIRPSVDMLQDVPFGILGDNRRFVERVILEGSETIQIMSTVDISKI